MIGNRCVIRHCLALFILLFPFFTGTAANYLCFTAEKAGSLLWYLNGADNNPDMQYSTDEGATWNKWNANDTIILSTIGYKVYVRGNNPNGLSHVPGASSLDDLSVLDCTYFKMTGSIAASGSVMSLIDGEGSTTVIPSGSEGCFCSLFRYCSSLTKAPELPATTLAEGCYHAMFFGSGLTEIPELPAMELAEYCYGSMFGSCYKLTKKPILPATRMVTNCYVAMFANSGLTEAPDLPAMELADNCYTSMFRETKNLVKAPELPAMDLAYSCYYGMFEGCGRLTTAPELPATKLAKICYSEMFKNCNNLNYIKVGALTLDNDVYATQGWVSGIVQKGVFIFPCGSKYDKHGISEVPNNFTIVASPIVIFQNPDSTELWRDTIGCDVVPVYKGETPTYHYGLVFKGWDKELQIHPEPDVYYYTATYDTLPARTNYLCFTAEEANSTVGIVRAGSLVDLQYSYNGEEPWTQWESDNVLTLRDVGDKVYVKGDNPGGFSMNSGVYANFRMTGRIAASGSVMSLIDGAGTSRVIPNDYCFERLFYGCTSLVQAPDLPATELTDFCYDNMFDHCSITRMPELPASNLAEGCYAGMFRNCTELTETTPMAALIMRKECYKQMFKGCTSLVNAPSLIAKNMAESCYESMFEGCTSMVSPPVLPAREMAPSCYSYMFRDCTSLTESASIPGVPMAKHCCAFMYSGCKSLTSTGFLSSHELAPYCYAGMFQGCSNLTRVSELPATELAESCYYAMFTQCSSLTEAPELPAMELEKGCYEDMFSQCKSLVRAPELPAMELKENCYKGMFSLCSSLNYIKVGVYTLDNEFNATKSWVTRVDGPGIFIFPCGSTYNKHGVSEVPDSFRIASAPIAIYQNPDGTEIWRDTFGCGESPEYNGPEPTYLDGYIFKEWKRILTSESDPDLWYFVAEYEDGLSDAANWLYFTAKEAGTTISYKNVGGNNPSVQYSRVFGGSWTPLAEGEKVILENVGDRVFLKGNNSSGFSHAEDVYTQFEIEGLADLSGSVMSLIDGKGLSKVIPNDYCFTHLFENCKINRIMEWYPLPALTIKAYCYSYMFAGCDTLLNAVSTLPATELAPYCYSHMYEGCTNIPTIPVLPADELAEGCYAYMFNRCSSMYGFGDLPATKLAAYCYSHMFSDCVFMYDLPQLPALKMAPYCYESMFSGCNSIEKMPLLLARSLAEGCYSDMFRSCKKLKEVFSLPANELSDLCYHHMFDGCVSLTEVPPLPAKETKSGCYDGMFRGCIGIVKAPELPAGELTPQCYRSMFEGCSSLNYIKVGVLTLDNDFGATYNWVNGVDGPGTFIFPCGSTYDKHGDSEVPDHFDIISSPIIIFQNPDSTVLGRDTIGCEEVPEYKGATPTFRDGLVFSHWDRPLEPLREAGIFYFTAEYGSEENPDLVNVLSFTAVEPNSSIWYYSHNGNQPDIQYSLDWGETWVPWKLGDTVNLNRVGDRVYVKGNNPQGFSHGEKIVQKTTQFAMSGGISASGSVMSLIDGKGETTVIPCDSCFYGLFSSCTALRKAPRLPATTLTGSCYMFMFSNCSNLREAPELPATEMVDNCYSHMFYDTRITTPPVLPAMKLAAWCYSGMFFKCIELTKMPELPATELAEGCYNSMFGFCENLTQVTDLPAMKMEEYCYCNMFSDCIRLRVAPKLPATELAPNCYSYMFGYCKSLTEAPELPATELVDSCYVGMFFRNECLIEAPELLATELKKNCYQEMFGSCTALNYIKVGVLSLDNDFGATEYWVGGVDRKGTFIFPCGSKYDKHGASEVPTNFDIISSPIVVFQNPDGTELQRDTIDCEMVPAYRGEEPTYGDGLVFKGWDPEPTVLPFPDTYYFTAEYEEKGSSASGSWLSFVAEEANTVISYTNFGGNAPNLQYSTDGGHEWFRWEEGKNVILENAGDTLCVMGNNPNGFSFSSEKYTTFSSNYKIAASGSVMSLIDPTDSISEIPNAYCFHQLFSHSLLTQAPELPATSLKDYCYSFMFSHCEHLTRTPELPATEMAKACYYFMFANCVSLNEVPSILPATQLADSCYSWMFESCRSLEKAPSLPATTMASCCYFSMFGDCASLSEAPELPATQLAENCYTLMLTDCKSLSQAPKLPATQLERYCYSGMFYGCTNMEEAPELPATELVEGCYNGMFAECTALVKAPELLAPKLVQECYRGMFENCSNLNYIQVGVMTLDNDVIATLDWVVGVDGPGTFVFPCGSKYDKHGVSEVPTNFTIVSSPIVVFRNADSTELQRDTIDCQTVPEYRGEEPTIGEGYTFKGWDNDLTTLSIPATYYYTAVYEKEKDPVPANWLCFTAEEKGSQVWYTNDHGGSPDVHYSIDGGETWIQLYRGDRITLENVGDKVYLKGDNAGGFSHVGMHNSFSMTGKIAASGSVMSLIDAKGVTTVIPNDSCFIGLFSGCQALTQAPELTATTLTNGCYLNMFSACESLAKAPELPATELADHCYEYMFTHCKGLESAPELPATEMKDFCYKGMFQGCWSLVTAPKLPSKSLAFSCYTYMFGNCFGLENAPELPATTLAPGCYAFMFSECSSLAQAPELPASTLVESCYQKMFKGCKQLNYIKVGVMSLDNDLLATMDWVNGVDGPGTFIFPCGSKYDKHGASEVPTDFTIVSSPIVIFQNWDSTELQRDTIDCETVPEYRGEEPVREGYTFAGWDPELSVHPEAGVYYYTARYEDPSANNWLCFTAESDSSAFSYTTHEQHYPDVQYSIDGGLTWKKLEPGVTVKMGGTGKKVYLKGNNPDGFSISDTEYSTFVTEGGGISASGSVMSLVDGNGLSTKIPNNFCFAYLFKGAEFLTHAPELPATILKEYCYLGMFNQCSRLTQAPVLPATRLESYCYANMFSECVSLEKAPELPATEISHYCYYNMFYGCEKLKVAPKLPAEVVYACCYAYMFQNCSSLVELPELPATEMAEACYLAMFQKCVLAEKAPALPAMTLWEGCYESMFSGCSSLTSAPELPAMNLKTRCYRSMFEDCISLTTAPVLPATALHPSCYHSMFRGCTNLNYIEVGVMSLDNDFEATENWVSGVDGPGTFIFPCGSKYDKHGVSEVPTDFTIISSPIVVFQNPGGIELWRDTVDCKTVPEYKGEEPFIGEDYTFVGWDNELTVLPIPDVYYYTAVYEEKDPLSVVDSTISACDSIVFEGVTYRESASWKDTLSTTEGVDYVIAYHLTLHQSVTVDTTITAEESYTWKDVTYTENASWSDTLQTVNGCDSIVNINLIINGDAPIPVTDTTIAACDSYVHKGITYSENSVWNDTLTNAAGEARILTYHLTLHQSVTVDTTITAEESYTWKDVTYTESASWNDTLQTAAGCDSIIRVKLIINGIAPTPVTDTTIAACESYVHKGVTYSENSEWSDTLQTSDGGSRILVYHLTIHKGVTMDSTIIAEGSFTWKGTTYTEDASWSDTLQTVNGCDSVVNYRLIVNEEKSPLQLTVEDDLYLVLPGGSETISYELTGGEGSTYEVRYKDKTLCKGDVTNDSTVSLTCPKELEPGAYTATLTMYDGEGEKAEKEFAFNVMLPDNKQKSYYVKVWNDVVICRNGEGQFLTYQWYKGRKKCEEAAQQFYNDKTLLDGEYMVYVSDKNGKSYFIEPITYAPVEAAYAITAEPNVVARGTDFTVKVSGVSEEDLPNARVVVYRANGVVEKLIDEVELESTMRLKTGEYVIVLTVHDGKNANCKVLVK